MHVVYTDRHQLHAPDYFLVRGKRQASPEVPLRAENLVAAARASGHTIVAPDDFGPAPRAAIHDAGHLQFLETAHRRWAEYDGATVRTCPHAGLAGWAGCKGVFVPRDLRQRCARRAGRWYGPRPAARPRTASGRLVPPDE